jgi:hypothetical protein
MSDHSQELLMELVQQGLKARFVARPDACPACRKLHGRVFDALDAPPVPLEECLTAPCRCRYEPCDPSSTVERLLRAAIAAVKEDRLSEAKELLYQVIELDERNQRAWLWLSGVAEGIDERITCLVNVLALNPEHDLARRGLSHLLAQRREVGPGQTAAWKIKQARDAIGRIKASPDKISALGHRPAVVAAPKIKEVVAEEVAERPVVREVREREKVPVTSIATAFLYLLLAASILLLLLVLAFRLGGIL